MEEKEMQNINKELVALTKQTIKESLSDEQCIEIMNNLIGLEMYLRELKHKYSEHFSQVA